MQSCSLLLQSLARAHAMLPRHSNDPSADFQLRTAVTPSLQAAPVLHISSPLAWPQPSRYMF